MDFIEHLKLAQSGNKDEIEALLERYRPLIRKLSTVDGVFDEDLYQEQCLRFLIVLKKFGAL